MTAPEFQAMLHAAGLVGVTVTEERPFTVKPSSKRRVLVVRAGSAPDGSVTVSALCEHRLPMDEQQAAFAVRWTRTLVDDYHRQASAALGLARSDPSSRDEIT